jgi:hypothetical protein
LEFGWGCSFDVFFNLSTTHKKCCFGFVFCVFFSNFKKISPPGLPFEVPLTGKLALVPGLGEFLLSGAVGRYLLEDRVPMAFHSPVCLWYY